MKSDHYDMKSVVSPPFCVHSLDLFDIYENDYSIVGYFQDLKAAILAAQAESEKSIKSCGSIEGWSDSGSEGLVYDSQGALVWGYRRDYLDVKKGE